MKYVPPGLDGSIVSVEPRYENFIGGKWLAPTHGKEVAFCLAMPRCW